MAEIFLTFPVIADNLSTPFPVWRLDCTCWIDVDEEGFETLVWEGVVGVLAFSEFEWMPPT